MSLFFSLRLRALQYPHANVFDISDAKQVQTLVAWLEDMKIRHYKIEQRGSLKDDKDHKKWEKAYVQYLVDLECPYASDANRTKQISWLLAEAVGLEYSDHGNEVAQKVEALAKKTMSHTGSNIDCTSPEFASHVETLRAGLRLPENKDQLAVLRGACQVVSGVIGEKQAETQKQKQKESGKDGGVVSRDISSGDFPMGMSTGDKALDKAVRVLRLLHVAQLRVLQTAINEVIATAQEFTADPKTDAQLGRVGR
eukprot:Rmarinus@m.3606